MTKLLPIDFQKSLFTEARTVHAFEHHAFTDAQIKDCMSYLSGHQQHLMPNPVDMYLYGVMLQKSVYYPH